MTKATRWEIVSADHTAVEDQRMHSWNRVPAESNHAQSAPTPDRLSSPADCWQYLREWSTPRWQRSSCCCLFMLENRKPAQCIPTDGNCKIGRKNRRTHKIVVPRHKQEDEKDFEHSADCGNDKWIGRMPERQQ